MSKNMIKLNFDIYSFFYDINNKEKNYKNYKISEEVEENKTLNEVVKKLYDKYQIKCDMVDNYYMPNIDDLLWSQYFAKEVYYHIEVDYEDYLNVKITDLDKQFNISKLVIPLWFNRDGIGRAVGVIHGVELYFHSNEKDLHHKPHIHCKYGEDETRVEIKTLKILDKPLKKSKMKPVIEFIIDHQKELIDYWDRVIVNGESIKFKIEI